MNQLLFLTVDRNIPTNLFSPLSPLFTCPFPCRPGRCVWVCLFLFDATLTIVPPKPHILTDDNFFVCFLSATLQLVFNSAFPSLAWRQHWALMTSTMTYGVAKIGNEFGVGLSKIFFIFSKSFNLVFDYLLTRHHGLNPGLRWLDETRRSAQRQSIETIFCKSFTSLLFLYVLHSSAMVHNQFWLELSSRYSIFRLPVPSR